MDQSQEQGNFSLANDPHKPSNTDSNQSVNKSNKTVDSVAIGKHFGGGNEQVTIGGEWSSIAMHVHVVLAMVLKGFEADRESVVAGNPVDYPHFIPND